MKAFGFDPSLWFWWVFYGILLLVWAIGQSWFFLTHKDKYKNFFDFMIGDNIFEGISNFGMFFLFLWYIFRSICTIIYW